MPRTQLYATHVAAGGRMVSFAGWELPVQYPAGPLEEHRAVRTAAGLFDIDHMGQFRVTGPDAQAYLQFIQSWDNSAVAVGEAHYGLLCYQDGGIVDDIFVYRLPDQWMVAVNAANRAKDWLWMKSHTQGFDVTLVDISDETYMLALQGPDAETILQPLVDQNLSTLAARSCIQLHFQDVPMLVGRTGYTGEDGFELFFPVQAAEQIWQALVTAGAPHGLLPCGLAARDSLRFEACLALYGHEINARTNPYQARLGWVVSLEKGVFMGRDALLKARLEMPDSLLIGFEMVERAVPREGYGIAVEGEVVGHVTTGMKSPTLDTFLGLGYVPRDVAKIGATIQILVRDRPRTAKIVKRPFYRPRYKESARS